MGTQSDQEAPPTPGPQRLVSSAPLLEDAVNLLQHMAQALVLGHPAGQGDLKQAGLCLRTVPRGPGPILSPLLNPEVHSGRAMLSF